MTQRERQEHAKKTIFQAALAEFGAQPYDTVTMDRICSRHGISKGMMYHYFSSKDELFLLCVKELFQSLQAYIQEESTQIQKENSHAAIRQYFMLRERFFAREPAWEVIFESAMVHMPEHLRADILELRRPVREMNRRFLQEVIAEMSLRPAVKAEHANSNGGFKFIVALPPYKYKRHKYIPRVSTSLGTGITYNAGNEKYYYKMPYSNASENIMQQNSFNPYFIKSELLNF